MGGWWHKNRPNILSGLVLTFARLLGATLRVKRIGQEIIDRPGAKIYLMWHGRTLIPAYLFRNQGHRVIISLSRDGEMQNRILSGLGYVVIRGSTGRGGERALVEAIRALKSGHNIAITPDGPRGPAGRVTDGVMTMAKRSGLPLVPTTTSARPRKLVRSWDRYMIPYPFAKCVAMASEPIFVPANADAEATEELRLRIQAEMHRIQDEAEAMLGFATKSVPCEGGR